MEKEKLLEEFMATFTCITHGCDNNGTIPVQNAEGEWEPEQCEYCFVKRFPARDFLDKALTLQKEELKKMIEGKRKPEVGEYKSTEDIKDFAYNQALDDIISELNHQ